MNLHLHPVQHSRKHVCVKPRLHQMMQNPNPTRNQASNSLGDIHFFEYPRIVAPSTPPRDRRSPR